MSANTTLTLDGRSVSCDEGETLLDVARRCDVAIPTLCHDPRLSAAGTCRMCLVEIAGWPRLAPACATPAKAGLVVETSSERVLRHRRALLALYAVEHPADEARREDELASLLAAGDLPDLGRSAPLRAGRPANDDPYIRYDAERCILCGQCVRYCDEVVGVAALTLADRGARTTVTTADDLPLAETTCELCGGCVAVCPTGALIERSFAERAAKASVELERTRTTCNYCGVGCQLDLHVDPRGRDGLGEIVRVTPPPPGQTTGDGNLCVKGRFGFEFLHHPDRLTTPLIRDDDGALQPASWDEALARTAQGLRGVAERHGPDALGFVSSSRCTVEENYLVQKLARAVFGTHNVHQCAAT